MELKLSHSSLPTIIINSSSLFPKNFSLLAQLQSNGGKLRETQLPKPTLSLEFHSRKLNQLLKVPSTHHLSLAKTTGSFLVLVPLIAFCLGCIMSAFQSRVSGKMRNQAENKSLGHDRASNSMRWKTVLGDLKDPDALDAVSEPSFDQLSEDQEYLNFEASSHDYTKLEDDYQKFLSECGMSRWGHWRGGSPE